MAEYVNKLMCTCNTCGYIFEVTSCPPVFRDTVSVKCPRCGEERRLKNPQLYRSSVQTSKAVPVNLSQRDKVKTICTIRDIIAQWKEKCNSKAICSFTYKWEYGDISLYTPDVDLLAKRLSEYCDIFKETLPIFSRVIFYKIDMYWA